MLERTHTMQNAGGVVAGIAILYVVFVCVCVRLSVCKLCIVNLRASSSMCVHMNPNYTAGQILITN